MFASETNIRGEPDSVWLILFNSHWVRSPLVNESRFLLFKVWKFSHFEFFNSRLPPDVVSSKIPTAGTRRWPYFFAPTTFFLWPPTVSFVYPSPVNLPLTWNEVVHVWPFEPISSELSNASWTCSSQPFTLTWPLLCQGVGSTLVGSSIWATHSTFISWSSLEKHHKPTIAVQRVLQASVCVSRRVRF